MNIVLFYHSLLSDWNHGNAHFLRGIATELVLRGNNVQVYEPENAWSLQNLIADHGTAMLEEFEAYYPHIRSSSYHPGTLNLDEALKHADLVIVHEWNDHALVQAIGETKARHGFTLLFHDTHHRAVTEKESMQRYDLSRYDGVLAFGNVIRDIYLQEGWTKNAWTWHEAADTRIFKPMQSDEIAGDFVWVGNWGDNERTKELLEFIIEPVKEMGLKARIYGVRYPPEAIAWLQDAGIDYAGWLPNYKVPEVFARYRFTAHVPRGPYVRSLPGIPTIRPFEAMACGIPLICSPWSDAENLFTPGKDYLAVKNKAEMKRAIERVLNDEPVSRRLVENGLQTIQQKHTCSHRTDELYAICEALEVNNFSKQNIA